MLAAFWSNIDGNHCVTSNLAGVSIVNAIEYKEKSLVFENHQSLNGLESIFIGAKDFKILKEESAYYFNHIGIDTLIKKLHSKLEQVNMIEGASIKLLDGKIFYIPQNYSVHADVLEYDLNKVINPLIARTTEYAEYVFVDTAYSDNLSSKIILDKADVVVVNLSQNPNIIEHFFQNYGSLTDKAFFIIGRYDKTSKYNLANIRRKYKIKKERIGVIPYNVDFKDSLIDGSTIEFMLRYYQSRKGDENYYFIKELKNVVRLLRNRLSECEKMKQCIS